MKKIFAMILVAAMMLTIGAGALAANTITKDAAKQIALEAAGKTADQVRFMKAHLDNDDGRLEWEIEFVQGGMEYEFDIDARTAAVLEMDIDRVD